MKADEIEFIRKHLSEDEFLRLYQSNPKTMTNEQKANEICDSYANSKFIPTQEECVAYSSAMEMANGKIVKQLTLF